MAGDGAALVGGAFHARIASVSVENAALDVVTPASLPDFVDDPAFEWGSLDGKQSLHAPIQVARHPVCRRQIDQFLVGIAKDIQPGMLQESANDGGNLDVIRNIRDARTQTTDAPDQQFDFHAGI